MKDIWMGCADDACVCEDMCCQSCFKADYCIKRCKNIRYKQKIYSSDDFLIEELEKAAEDMDCWLLAVAAERLRELAHK